MEHQGLLGYQIASGRPARAAMTQSGIHPKSRTMTTCPFKQHNDYKINWEATTFGEPKPPAEPNAPATDDDLVAVKYED